MIAVTPDCEGAHIYCRSRKDGKDGFAYLIVYNSLTEVTEIELPTEAEVYALCGNVSLRASTMCLNGKPLELSGVSDTTELVPEKVEAGKLSIAPASCTFIVI